MPSPRQELGQHGEVIARDFLRKKGMVYLSGHWTCRFGELDLIMKDGEEVVFVEVKLRREDAEPEHAVSFGKLSRMRRAAEIYLDRFKGPLPFYRFDIVAISETAPEPQIHHLQDVLRE